MGSWDTRAITGEMLLLFVNKVNNKLVIFDPLGASLAHPILIKIVQSKIICMGCCLCPDYVICTPGSWCYSLLQHVT